MNEVLRQVEDEKYRLQIFYEHEPVNPRSDGESFYTIACKQGRYSFGDLDIDQDENVGAWGTARDGEFRQGNYFVLPVYAYVHGGVALSAVPFAGSNFDSGQIGWMYGEVSDLESALACSGGELSRQVKQQMLEELEAYNSYLRGEVYGFSVESVNKCEHCGAVKYEALYGGGNFIGSSLEDVIEQMRYDVTDESEYLFDKLV